MKVTPLDLRQQKFKTVMRGFDRAEVESFLAETADDYETGAARGRSPARRPDPRAGQPRGASREASATSATRCSRRRGWPTKSRRTPRPRASASCARPRAAPTCCSRKRRRGVEEMQREIDGLRLKRRDVESSLEGPSRPCATRWSSCASRTSRSARTRCCSTGRGRRDSAAPMLRVVDELKVAEARAAPRQFSPSAITCCFPVRVTPRAGRTALAGMRDWSPAREAGRGAR